MSTFKWYCWPSAGEGTGAFGFESRAKTQHLGRFEPGQSPAIFNPLATGNREPWSTFNHETVHATLTQDTAFGLFFETLYRLHEAEPFAPLAVAAYEDQWEVQEGCANYVAMTTFAHSRESFERALAELPSGKAGQPRYREVFETIAAVIPIEPGASPERLAGLRYFVTAIGRLSMDNDCLVQFLDSSRASHDNLQVYLRSQSPDLRLKRILQGLKGRADIFTLLGQVETAVKADFHPVRVAMGGILELIPGFAAVSGIELNRQYALFKEAWQPALHRYAAEEQPPEMVGRMASIPAVTAPPELSLTLGDVRDLFAAAKADRLGLWAVIAFLDDERLYLDLMPYELGRGENPVWTPFTQACVRQRGFSSGEFFARDVIAIVDDFPGMPHAITFMHGAWDRWDRLTQGRQAGHASVKASMAMALSEVSLQVMLAYRDMRLHAKYVLAALDVENTHDKAYFAYFADASQPGIYGVQYIPGRFGLQLFRQIASAWGIEEFDEDEMARLDEIIPHLGLLQLMSIPSLRLAATGTATGA